MQTTSPYWNDTSFEPLKFPRPISGHLGFQMKMPWPYPVTVGAIYTGDGAIPGRREVSNATFGEYFAINDTIPSSGGVPLVDTSNPIFRYSRAHHVYKV
jgi:hypothetical protein